MLRSIPPGTRSVQRKTRNLVDELHTFTFASHRHDDATSFRVAALFECIQSKRDTFNNTLR